MRRTHTILVFLVFSVANEVLKLLHKHNIKFFKINGAKDIKPVKVEVFFLNQKFVQFEHGK